MFLIAIWNFSAEQNVFYVQRMLNSKSIFSLGCYHSHANHPFISNEQSIFHTKDLQHKTQCVWKDKCKSSHVVWITTVSEQSAGCSEMDIYWNKEVK